MTGREGGGGGVGRGGGVSDCCSTKKNQPGFVSPHESTATTWLNLPHQLLIGGSFFTSLNTTADASYVMQLRAAACSVQARPAEGVLEM